MTTLPGYDAWKLMSPEDERRDEPCELCRRAGYGAPGKWFDATNDIWLCDDCSDELLAERLGEVLTVAGAMT